MRPIEIFFAIANAVMFIINLYLVSVKGLTFGKLLALLVFSSLFIRSIITPNFFSIFLGKPVKFFSDDIDKPIKHVAILSFGAHPALDAVAAGVAEALRENGYSEEDVLLHWTLSQDKKPQNEQPSLPAGIVPDPEARLLHANGKPVTLHYASAQGQKEALAELAQILLAAAPDVIVAVSTPAAQAAAAATQDVPIVFAAISDPRAAQLIPSAQTSGNTVTGVSDMPKIDGGLDLVLDALPHAQRIGVPYDPKEKNAVSQLNALKDAAWKKKISIVEAAVSDAPDIGRAARSLAGQADALYVLLDNTVVGALETVVKAGIDGKIPVFASDAASVQRGALAAVSVDYRQLGKDAGDFAAAILEGKKPDAMPVKFTAKTNVVVNPSAARAFGVAVPESLLTRAILTATPEIR